MTGIEECETDAEGDGRAWRLIAARFAELCALWGFAVAQPLLDVFGRSPETFVFLRAGGGTIMRFALLVGILPPVALAAIEAATLPLPRRVTATLHSALVALLGAAIAVQVTKYVVGWSGVIAIVIGLMAGLAFEMLRSHQVVVRTWLRYASLAPVVFVALFLAASPTSVLVGKGSAHTTIFGASSEGTGRPVVMLLLDEFPLATLLAPDGRIDAEQFPGFARLAASSTWYRNATSVQGETTLAVPAMLSGLYPPLGKPPPVWTEYGRNLFTLLGGDYEMNVSESLTGLCPPAVCRTDATAAPTPHGLGTLLARARHLMGELVGPSRGSRDLTAFAEAAPTESHAIDRSRQPARFTAFLDSLDRVDHRRSLSFLHLVLPHVPFVYLPSGHVYTGPQVLDGITERGGWSDDEWAVLLARERHLLQARYVDGLVGDLLDRLEETGLADDAWLIVTADHGASFTAGESFRFAGDVNYPEILWVPFFVRPPGGSPARASDANVETVDVLPTIADALDIKLAWKSDGRSVLGNPRAGTQKRYQRFRRGQYEARADELLTFDGVEGRRRVTDLAYPSARNGDPSWWPYEIGSHAGLVERVVASMRVGSPAGTFALDTPFPTAIAAHTAALPSWVSGHVHVAAGALPARSAPLDGAGRSVNVALALDGVIGAVVPTFEAGDGTSFAGMLPEPLLTPGAHHLEVFLVDDDEPTGTTLRPLRAQGNE